MADTEFYDGTKLLSMKDINGNTPEIFICCTNRNAGKTTYFNRLVMNKYLKKGEKFCIINRFNYELDDVADKFFKDIGSLFFFGLELRSKRKANGIYHELFLIRNHDEETAESCGYAISLNSADQIKKYSHLFSDVSCMVFDEFQSETNHYCSDEVKKFISIHTSIARGQGEQVRYVPVYMIGNHVSIINPYYVEMKISSRLNSKTKFLRGNGFVVEQGYNESASQAQKTSGFNQAFSDNSYTKSASGDSVYLNDNYAFIETPVGYMPRYLATIKYEGKEYAIKEYRDLGIIYCDDHPDRTFRYKISVTTDDHNINYVMLKSNDMFISTLRYYFDRGCFRFKDLKCKEAIFKCLSY